MRIYTRTVWEWQGDELVQTEAEGYDYEGPVDLAKGGKGPKNYANLERLYGIQADQAQFLGETFKGTVAPAYKSWLAESQDYGSQANQELAAQRAGKAASGAVSQQQQALQADLASMGINPADQRYAQGMREMGIQGAAQQASAETLARDTIRDKGFARQQDAIGMGMGTPTQAAQAANSAANAATSSLAAQNAANAQQASNVSGAIRGVNTIYNTYDKSQGGSGTGGYADGGQVRRYASGGPVNDYAPRGLSYKGRNEREEPLYGEKWQRPYGGPRDMRGYGGLDTADEVDARQTKGRADRDAERKASDEQLSDMMREHRRFSEQAGGGTGQPSELMEAMRRVRGSYANGGQVGSGRQEILRLAQGGYVNRRQHLARGGFAGGSTPASQGGGFMGTPQVAAPPPQAGPAGPSAAATAAGAASTPLAMKGMQYGLGKGAEAAGQATGSPGLTSFGQGLNMSPAQLKAAQQFNQASTQQAAEAAVDNAMGVPGYSGASHAATPAETDTALASAQAGAGQNAAALEASQVGATTAADAETALAASQAAEGAVAADAATTAAATGGLEAAGAGLGAAGAVAGTAVPVLGAGLALYGIGNAAGWWADGGEVTPGSQDQTGEVSGPGGPKSDEVLAALSDGEFVMPKGVVNYFGIKHLENMRQKGLQYEKQMGIG